MMPRLRLPRPVAAALALMLAVSCVDPTGSCACTPPVDQAVMYGRVTDPAGKPVASATVRAEAGPAGCQSTNEAGQAATDAGGRYRAVLYAWGPVECLRAFALPPAGGALRGSDTAAVQLRFAHPRDMDSTRLDLVLRAP